MEEVFQRVARSRWRSLITRHNYRLMVLFLGPVLLLVSRTQLYLIRSGHWH